MALSSLAGRIVPLGIALTLSLPASATPPGNVIAIPPPDQRGEDRVVGPEQLRDFQLGRDPREAPATPPRPAPAEPATPPPAAAPTRENIGTTPPPPARTITIAPRESGPTVTVPSAPPATGAAPDVDLPASAATAVDEAAPVATNPGAIAPRPLDQSDLGTEASAPGWWLLVLLPLIAIGAAWMAFRRRGQGVAAPVATAAPVPQSDPTPVRPEPFERSNPLADLEPPAPRAAAPPSPPPAAKAASAAPVGIVTTTLRPQIAMRVTPVRAAVDEEEIWLDYQVELRNTGSGAAFEVRVDGGLVNAGPDQDEAVATLFDRPPGSSGGAALPELSPGGSVQFQGRARRAIGDVRLLQAGDRKIAAPLLALRLTRAMGRGGESMHVETQLYFVGRSGGSDGRLAPLRIDTGPRLIRDAVLKPA
ncbi:hypothetical protein WJT74_08930 [Sphingomicrobium sp. XHP0239]|uniref:hypothetical protein n=1 Tax=Sphingomicrobium maritimum TaxID=3133972 RepID=UPI0031CCD647